MPHFILVVIKSYQHYYSNNPSFEGLFWTLPKTWWKIVRVEDLGVSFCRTCGRDGWDTHSWNDLHRRGSHGCCFSLLCLVISGQRSGNAVWWRNGKFPWICALWKKKKSTGQVIRHTFLAMSIPREQYFKGALFWYCLVKNHYCYCSMLILRNP